MKKTLSLFLALVMALSLCTTAFAGNTAGTSVIRLTGDAADQVVDLKNGQRLSADSSTLVRLNVLDDPSAEEYTVTLDDEKLTPDHSTSQYHFYAVPAAQSSAPVTLNVSTQALDQGDGTAANPYQIATADDLKAFRDRVNNGETTLNAILTADIALNKSETWTPIGSSRNKYNGTFDGQGHTISGLNVNEAGSNEAGLFGDTAQSNTSPVIKNLTIADSSFVTARGYAGGVAGYGGGVFENCHTEASVTVQGMKYAGGIIGSYKGTGITAELSMSQCSNRATVKAVNGSVGGFAGGLIGQAEHQLKLEKSFNAGVVSSKPSSDQCMAGGLVGTVSCATTLVNVYNVGDVSVSRGADVAGLVGNSVQKLTITNAYQHGTVTAGSGSTGAAIVAKTQSDATLQNVYKTSKLADCVTKGGTAKVTGKATVKTEDELKGLATLLRGEFVNDLPGDAAVNNGFPVLKWQNAAAAAADTLTVTANGTNGIAMLDDAGSTDPAQPTEKTIAFDCESMSTYTADRIYLNLGEDNTGTVKLGLALSESGELSQTLTSQKDGYTADELYFYRTPAMVERTVYAVHTQDGTTRYYKLTIQRTAYNGTRYGAMSANWRDDNPVIHTTYDATTGYLTATVNVHNAFARFTNGVMNDSSRAKGLFTYDPEFKYYAAAAKSKDNDANQVVRFARMGWYWMTNESSTDSRSDIPAAAWWGSKDVADSYINAANALKTQASYSSLPAELRTAFENAVKAVSDSWSDGTAAQPLYLDANGNQTTAVTALKARDAMGAPMTGEYKLEQQENLMLDYMDIVKTYLNDSTLGSLKYRALQNVLSGITDKKEKLKTVTALAITNDTTKAAYEYYRQRVWRIVNASDMTEINSMLADLRVDKVALEVTSAKTQVIVGDKPYDLELTGGGTGNYDRTLVTVTAVRGTGMQRVYFTRTQNVTVVTSGWEAILEKGYTANNAYFYDTPTEQSLTIAVNVDENGTTRYYNVKVVYPAQSGLTLGPNASIGTSNYREDAPGSLNSYDSSTGYISGGVEFGSMIYASMNLYTDGVSDKSNIKPDWGALAAANNKLYYLEGTQAYFARPGYYWLPVTNGTTSGLLPMRASVPYNSVGACLTAATNAGTNVTTLTDDAKELMDSVYNKVNGFKLYFSDALYLNSDGTAPKPGCTADKITKGTSIQARTYFGAPLYGISLVEKELNTLLDLTAIFTTWGTNADLAAQQFEAYQKILNMKGGIHNVMDIHSTADRDKYQEIRQAKWDLLKTTDLEGINAILTSLNLEQITPAEPQVTLGDVDDNGEINMNDAALLIRYCNNLTTLTDEQRAAAELNGDSEINMNDAALLIRYCNNLLPSFPTQN